MIRVYIIAADTPKPLRFTHAEGVRGSVDIFAETIDPGQLTDLAVMERIQGEFRSCFAREARHGR